MDYTEIVTSSLHKIGGLNNSGSIWICCPFHVETKPSCSVAGDSSVVPIGTFHCFGCGKSGSWNTLAKEIGAPTIDSRLLRSEFEATPRITKSTYFDDSVENYLLANGFNVYTKWSDPDISNLQFFKKWYSINGKLLFNIGAYLVKEKDGIHRLFLPVIIWNKIYGATRVAREKKDGVKMYLNTPGNWAEDFGLFPFDYVVNRMERYNTDFIILVEGPRDALRLINLGFPAIATLSANSFSDKKADIISSIRGVSKIYIMPDADMAGDKMLDLCRLKLKNKVGTSYIRLPELTVVNGEQKRTDPQSVDLSFLRNLRSKLRLVHNKSTFI
jgi:5S rRNA maturation endonuclease (ribonuclease M5)